MWRFCDLHNHSTPNEQCDREWDADEFCQSAVDAGIDVVALTDHDHCDHVEEALTASDSYDLVVIAGIELSTDQGHVLALAPGVDGLTAIRDFTRKVSAVPGSQISFDALMGAHRAARSPTESYADCIVLIGAHVDRDKSLLASSSTFSATTQLDSAKRLHALEVSDPSVMETWRLSGVKQSDHRFALIAGSDTHDPQTRRKIGTWIYLPEVSFRDLRHAFAMPEASISIEIAEPEQAEFAVNFIEFSGGGLHDGERFDFSSRANAIIGAPNAGKSLIIDAFKFVFNVACDLPEVESITDSRMKKRLPKGTVVKVGVTTPDGQRTLERTVGGASAPDPPFTPIIFSQTELTRRSIATSPAIQLLDLHCGTAATAKQAIADLAKELDSLFVATCEKARSAQATRAIVDNPEDGLAASSGELESLAGHESVATVAMQLEKIKGWHDRSAAVIDGWMNDGVEPIVVPDAPSIEDPDGTLASLIPAGEIEAISQDGQSKIDALVQTTKNKMESQLDLAREKLTTRTEQSDENLDAQGFTEGSDLLDRVRSLQSRVSSLETQKATLTALESEINQGLVDLHQLVADIENARGELTRQRKDGCRRVNDSMHSFFAQVDGEGETSRLNELFGNLKVGTNLRPTTQQTAIANLDRKRLIEYAIRQLQGQPLTNDPVFETQDKVVAEAVDRDKLTEIAELASCFPGDSLGLGWKEQKPPTPFAGLTEGLRALAIKEISFAASKLPVISDQPEDAVPTRSVFTSLVPTLREQRSTRQFIVVSHDANIVVTSDVERIIVLAGQDETGHSAGGLFDSDIQAAALEHLEGGRQAFMLRSDRYGSG